MWLKDFVHMYHISPGVLARTKVFLEKPSGLERVCEDPMLRRMVAHLMKQTWFTTQGLGKPSRTHGGTKAGNPFGRLALPRRGRAGARGPLEGTERNWLAAVLLSPLQGAD